MAMVDIVQSIQECPCQFMALLLKHVHTPRNFKLLLVVISDVYEDRCLKCDATMLACAPSDASGNV
jgi:hypothetical protein